MLFRLFHSFLEPKFSTRSLTSAFWASANPVSCQCHAATLPRHSRMIWSRGRCLNSWESRKRTKNLTKRLLALFLRCLMVGLVKSEFGSGFGFWLVLYQKNFGTWTIDSWLSRIFQVPYGSLQTLPKPDRPWSQLHKEQHHSWRWHSSQPSYHPVFFAVEWWKTNATWNDEIQCSMRPAFVGDLGVSSRGVVSDAGAPLPVGPCHDSKPRSGVDKQRLKAIVQTHIKDDQRWPKNDKKLRHSSRQT